MALESKFMNFMQFFLTFEKSDWEDNTDILIDFLVEFERQHNETDKSFIIFKGKQIPRYFLKIYFTIQKRFLLSDKEEKQSMFPIWFFNGLFKMALDSREIQKIALKHKFLRFTVENCLFHQDFEIETRASLDKTYKFGRNQIKMSRLFRFYLEMIVKLLRENTESHEQIKDLNNFLVDFIRKRNKVLQFCEYFFGIDPSNTYLLLYEISSYFYNCQDEMNFVVGTMTTDQIFSELLDQRGNDIDNDYKRNRLNFLVRSSVCYSNCCYIAKKRVFLAKLYDKYENKIEIYLTEIIWNVLRNNFWHMIPRTDGFIICMVCIYESFPKPLGYLQNKILEIFTDRCTYCDLKSHSK